MQYYTKEKDNSIRGPYYVNTPNFFPDVEYQNYLNLLKQERIFVVDKKQYIESFLVKLPLRMAKLTDFIDHTSNYFLKTNHIYYLKELNKMSGPFPLKTYNQMYSIKSYISFKQCYILDYVNTIEIFMKN
jgi:hypothetical protein